MISNSSPARDRLEKAYFEFLEQEHYSKITVSDIISKAGVSRTTFYRHYTDIFDMHKKVAERLSGEIIDNCMKRVIEARNEEECFNEILNIFNSQEKYIILISGQNGSRYFFEAMFYKTSENLFPGFANISDDQLFRIRFMTIATIGVYVRDIMEGREHHTGFITICKKMLNFEELFGGPYAK